MSIVNQNPVIDLSQSLATRYGSISLADYTDAALCLWEIAFESIPRQNNGLEAEPNTMEKLGQDLRDYMDKFGVGDTRALFMGDLPIMCHQAWSELHPQEFDDSFDLEFVPLFLRTCVEVDSFGLILKEDYMSILRGELAADNELSPAQ